MKTLLTGCQKVGKFSVQRQSKEAKMLQEKVRGAPEKNQREVGRDTDKGALLSLKPSLGPSTQRILDISGTLVIPRNLGYLWIPNNHGVLFWDVSEIACYVFIHTYLLNAYYVHAWFSALMAHCF